MLIIYNRDGGNDGDCSYGSRSSDGDNHGNADCDIVGKS